MIRDIPELTVLLPCLNEEKTIGLCIDQIRNEFKKFDINGTILVADNGSTDESIPIIKKMNVNYINVDKKGYGAALIAGINHSKSKYTLMADSDLTYDFTHIKNFLDEINKGFDLVVGNRFKGHIEKGAMPFMNRYIGNPILSRLGLIFFNNKAKDFHCGIRIFDTKKIKDLNLKAPGMEFASEMICKSVINRLEISEIPTNLLKTNTNRVPHLRPFRDGLRHISIILNSCFEMKEEKKWKNWTKDSH